MENKYYGIGKENSSANKYTISLFFGSCFLTIAFYTKRYKFKPRFYFFQKGESDYMKSIGWFKLKWFFGFSF